MTNDERDQLLNSIDKKLAVLVENTVTKLHCMKQYNELKNGTTKIYWVIAGIISAVTLMAKIKGLV